MNAEHEIEAIWDAGFLNSDEPVAPKVNRLYKAKSKLLGDATVRQFEKEIWLVLPLALIPIGVNFLLGSDNALFWSVLCTLPSLAYFALGIRQLRSLKHVDVGASCRDYLVSLQAKLVEVRRQQKVFTVGMIPVIFIPILIYTCWNNRGKTLGETLGFDSLTWPNATLFLLVPVFTLLVYVICEFSSKYPSTNFVKINELILDMDELSQGT